MFKPVVFAFLVLSGLAVGARSLSAQSLADVAKKEEERRKAIPAPAKVYTNKDLGAAPAGSPPVVTPAATAAADLAQDKDGKDKDAKDKDAKGTGVKDQAYWSGRLKSLQMQLERDQSFAVAIQTRINALTTDFVNRDDPAQKAVIDRDRQKAIAELARLTKAVQDDTKAVADFMEEARRAAVPPGWLR